MCAPVHVFLTRIKPDLCTCWIGTLALWSLLFQNKLLFLGKGKALAVSLPDSRLRRQTGERRAQAFSRTQDYSQNSRALPTPFHHVNIVPVGKQQRELKALIVIQGGMRKPLETTTRHKTKGNRDCGSSWRTGSLVLLPFFYPYSTQPFHRLQQGTLKDISEV